MMIQLKMDRLQKIVNCVEIKKSFKKTRHNKVNYCNQRFHRPRLKWPLRLMRASNPYFRKQISSLDNNCSLRLLPSSTRSSWVTIRHNLRQSKCKRQTAIRKLMGSARGRRRKRRRWPGRLLYRHLIANWASVSEKLVRRRKRLINRFNNLTIKINRRNLNAFHSSNRQARIRIRNL